MCINILPVQFFEQSISSILRGHKDVADPLGFEGVVSIRMEAEPVSSRRAAGLLTLEPFLQS